MIPGFILKNWKNWGDSNWDGEDYFHGRKSRVLDMITSRNVLNVQVDKPKGNWIYISRIFERDLCYRNALRSYGLTAEIKIYIYNQSPK